jgi:hypothetical protein
MDEMLKHLKGCAYQKWVDSSFCGNEIHHRNSSSENGHKLRALL